MKATSKEYLTLRRDCEQKILDAIRSFNMLTDREVKKVDIYYCDNPVACGRVEYLTMIRIRSKPAKYQKNSIKK